MADLDDLWDCERGFWLDGVPHYERHLAPDARMVFPEPAGILDAVAIMQGLEGAPRWESVDFDAQKCDPSRRHRGAELSRHWPAPGRSALSRAVLQHLCAKGWSLADAHAPAHPAQLSMVQGGGIRALVVVRTDFRCS